MKRFKMYQRPGTSWIRRALRALDLLPRGGADLARTARV